MSNRKTLLKAAALSLALSFPLAGQSSAQVRAAPAAGQPVPDHLSERLVRIENALQDLQGVVYAVEGGAPSNARPTMVQSGSMGVDPASMSVRLTAIEESLAQLTGQVEQLSWKLDQQQREVDMMRSWEGAGDTSGDLTMGDLITPEDAGDMTDMDRPDAMPLDQPNGGPVDLMGAGGSAASAIDLPDDSSAAYDMAYDAVLAADYDRAEETLEAFVQKFPDSPQTPEAKFLLGEVYLATGANGEAARIFLDHVGAYKDDPRSPEAYLKLGISFARLDKTEEACKVFRAGRSKFPDMPERMRRRYDNEKAAAGCQ